MALRPDQPLQTVRAGSGLPADRCPARLLAFADSVHGTQGIQRHDTNRWAGQCVSLVGRYIQDVHLPPQDRATPQKFGDGRFTAEKVARRFPGVFEPFESASAGGGLPRPGAIVSFDGVGPTSEFGHTGIIIEAQQRPDGRYIRILESNADSLGPNSQVRTTEWIAVDERAGYGKTVGWANPKADALSD